MLALLVVSLLWAFSFGLMKGNLVGVDANFIAAVRIGIASLVFLPFLKLKNVPRLLALQLMGIGALQFGVMYIAYNFSFKFLSAYEVALFTIFTPIYVTILNDALTRRFRQLNLWTALLAVIGTAVVVMNGWVENQVLTGFLLVQISNLAFAAGQVAYRKVMVGKPEVKDQSVFGLLYLGGFLAAGLSSAVFTPFDQLALTAKHIYTLVYLGLVASGLGFFLWNFGARRVEAGTLAIFNDLKIPLSITVSLVFFREQANLVNLVLGGAIVLAALVGHEWALRRQNRSAEVSLAE